MGSDTYCDCPMVRKSVSIHAPTWGATKLTVMLSKGKWFQSTLPHGERHAPAVADDETTAVSIHAPTWGATN